MENVESGQVHHCEDENCFVCKFSHRMHSLRTSGRKVWHNTSQKARNGMLEAGHCFQQRMPKAAEFIQTTCHKIGDSSRSAYTKMRPNLERWNEDCRRFSRDLKLFMDVAMNSIFLCMFYASVSVLLGVCLYHLAMSELSADILLAAFAMIVVAVLLPVYLWRSGLMDRLESRLGQETHQATPTPTKELPEYGPLVFSIPDDADHVAPPAYEEVMCSNGDPHVLQSDFRSGTNIMASVCPVHQHQSIARHPDLTQGTTSQMARMPPRSRSLGELNTVDTIPLLN